MRHCGNGLYLKMKNKLDKKGADRKLLLIGIAIALAIAIVGVVNSQQGELDELIGELESEGYSWLVDYNVSYPYIEVYEFNQSRLIATFPSISEGLYKILLTNLSSEENYSQDVFDLRVKDSDGNAEKIPFEILQKKMRIDEIRKELNQKGDIYE